MKRKYHIALVLSMIFLYFMFDSAINDYMDKHLNGWIKDIVYAMNMMVYTILFSILVYKIVRPDISVTKAYVLIVVYAVLWIIIRFWIIGYYYGGL